MLISDALLSRLGGQVAGLHSAKEYRPTAVILLVDFYDGRFLVVQSAKNRADWGFPQGGIESCEDIRYSIARELKEELAVESYETTLNYYLGDRTLDAEVGRVYKRGFSKRKHYFFFQVCFFGRRVVLKPEPKEIGDCRWVSRSELKAIFSTTREEKAEMLSSFCH